MLVTIAEAKEYLRIDGEEEEPLLASLISVVTAHCEDYLQTALSTEIPLPVKQAILILVAHFYEQRIGEAIPKVVYTLLSPYRAHQW
ncbi:MULTISPECIES: head-tail connector protein [Sporomusa]|uniref:head-tail connector protein n=1 Tax=Sporomusa ovata TaxID=2378 RepID=UPI00048D713B